MLDAVRFRERVEFVGQRVAIFVAIEQEFAQRGEGRARFQMSEGVKLDAIAGAEDYALAGDARIAQQLQRGGNARLGKSEPFAHRDGRGMVAEADDDDGHVYKIANGEWRIANGGIWSGDFSCVRICGAVRAA